MLSLYVYFKVSKGNADAARACVAALLLELGRPGIKTEFWRRQTEAADGTQTWMTVFHDVQSEFEAHLRQRAHELGLGQLAGPLSVERFLRCES